ncbi:MAG: T9SS type A sorting domain-containing protein [Ignavibacteriales bacterium]|nr:T9SS type A sorting domain-containing protein [Ignavibacteriales bacterium]
MNKSIIIILSILVSIQSLLFAQEILWKKNYGLNTTDDLGRSVIQTNDNGFAIVGYTNSFGADSFDVWLIKTNENGDTLWTRTYGGNDDDYGYDLKQTDDGGYILAGATSSFGAGGFDFYLIRADSLGDTLWTKTFGGVNDDYGRSVDIFNPEGFIIAGEKDANTSDSDDWIIKVDTEGNLLWSKSFGNEIKDQRLFSIKSLSDIGMIAAGATDCNGYAGCNGWVLRLDVNGDTLWTKSYYGSQNSDWFNQVTNTSDNGFAITGYNSILGFSNVWLVKTDSLGNEQWSKNYDYDHDIDVGYSVQQTQDGGYIVVGGASPPDIENRGWIIRTDSVGDTLWTLFINSFTNLNGTLDASTICYSVFQVQNGDYIVAGAQSQVFFQKEVMLLRISSDIVPVELTSFTAIAQQNNITLNWQTATETNNSGFEIERKQVGSPQSSVGNQDWNQIAFVPGFGTTTEPKSYSFTDENLSSGKYQYRLKQIDFDGTFEYSNTVEVEINSPTEFSLEQNYPNPFNPTTKIKYTVPSVTLRQAQSDILVSLKVFDVLGNEIATLVNEHQQPGTYEVEFNVGQAISLSSGVYYYQLRSGSFVETKKMILLR